MKKTPNYGLKKPDGTDLVNIEDLNSNMDIIDSQLMGRELLIKNAAAKISLAEADTFPLTDSAENSITKKITFSNMRAALKSYFDSFYNKYVHPSYTSRPAGLYKTTVDGTGHISSVAAVAKSDITALGIPSQDTVYTHPTYTARSSGLYKVTVDNKGHISAATVVTKADIIALGIPNTASYTSTIPTAWSGTSAPYTQSVNITGLLMTDKQIHITPDYSTTLNTAKAQKKAWSLISKGELNANNQILFTCFEEKPTTAVPIKVEIIK